MGEMSAYARGIDESATCCMKNGAPTIGLALRAVAHELRARGKSETLGLLYEGRAREPGPVPDPALWRVLRWAVPLLAGLALGIAL